MTWHEILNDLNLRNLSGLPEGRQEDKPGNLNMICPNVSSLQKKDGRYKC